VILTTSKAEEDIPRTYNLHANCYVTKPVDLDQFVKVVRSLEDFWLAIVKNSPTINNERRTLQGSPGGRQSGRRAIDS
jgi:DNA-binding NarL/FixJ family response regulator